MKNKAWNLCKVHLMMSVLFHFLHMDRVCKLMLIVCCYVVNADTFYKSSPSYLLDCIWIWIILQQERKLATNCERTLSITVSLWMIIMILTDLFLSQCVVAFRWVPLRMFSRSSKCAKEWWTMCTASFRLRYWVHSGKTRFGSICVDVNPLLSELYNVVVLEQVM